MSGPTSHTVYNGNQTGGLRLQLADFDKLTDDRRTYNLGTLVISGDVNSKTLKCVNYHNNFRMFRNTDKVSKEQIEDLRSAFDKAMTEDLIATRDKLVEQHPTQEEQIKSKFKQIISSFQDEINQGYVDADEMTELSRMDIRAYSKQAKALRNVSVECLLQLSTDELKSLSTDTAAADKARSIRPGDILREKCDKALGDLRDKLKKCDVDGLKTASSAMVKTLVPEEVKNLANYRSYIDNEDVRKNKPGIWQTLCCQTLRIQENYLENLICSELGEPYREGDTKQLKDYFLFKQDRQMGSFYKRVAAALEKLNVTAFKLSGETDKVELQFNDVDENTLRKDVEKLFKALGAFPPDKNEVNGLGEKVEAEDDEQTLDEASLELRKAFGCELGREELIDAINNYGIRTSSKPGPGSTPQ